MLYFYTMLEKLPLVFNNWFFKFNLISKILANTPSNSWPGLILATHRNSVLMTKWTLFTLSSLHILCLLYYVGEIALIRYNRWKHTWTINSLSRGFFYVISCMCKTLNLQSRVKQNWMLNSAKEMAHWHKSRTLALIKQ